MGLCMCLAGCRTLAASTFMTGMFLARYHITSHLPLALLPLPSHLYHHLDCNPAALLTGVPVYLCSTLKYMCTPCMPAFTPLLIPCRTNFLFSLPDQNPQHS